MNSFPEVAVAQKLKVRGEDKAAYNTIPNGVFYAGVFDGHNGPGAAIWCAENMADLIDKYYNTGLSTIATLTKSFVEADATIGDQSGTTASVLLMKNRYIVVAHVGDSRVVLCHGGNAVTITEDHHLDKPTENKRIEEAEKAEKRSLRFGSRVDGLMLTRSIGDHTLTKAISPYPVINEFLQTPKDEFLIIASDGFWDVCDGQTAMTIIKARKLFAAADIADALVLYATQQYELRRIRADDITCCVVMFDPIGADHEVSST